MSDPSSAPLAMKAVAANARACASACAWPALSGSGGVIAKVIAWIMGWIMARGVALLFVVLAGKAVDKLSSKVSGQAADLSVGAPGVAQSDTAYRLCCSALCAPRGASVLQPTGQPDYRPAAHPDGPFETFKPA